MAEIVILVGPPCSGKSTFVKELIENRPDKNYVVISSDDLIEEYAKENGSSYNEVFSSVGMKPFESKMFKRFHEEVQKGSNLIIDRTNMKVSSRNKFMIPCLNDKNKRYKDFTAVVFSQPLDVLFERNKNRNESTDKNIPKVAFYSMIKNYEEPTIEEGFTEIIHQ